MAGSTNGSPKTHRHTSFTVILWVLAALLPLRAADLSLEYQVKAAFLLNFTKFIDWPPEPDVTATPSATCILGDDPFGPALDQMVNGETLQGRRLEVMRVHRPSRPPAKCSLSVDQKRILQESWKASIPASSLWAKAAASSRQEESSTLLSKITGSGSISANPPPPGRNSE
jgi:hypothetical protein